MTDNKYQRGQIYSIRSHQTDLIYIGSTIQPLHKRFYEHKSGFKTEINYTSKEIMKYDDAYIELIEDFPCNSKKELTKREGYYIRNTNCVNTKIAGRTKDEWYVDNKQYCKIKAAKKYIENKPELSKKQLNYALNHKQEKHDYDKKYRELNKEKLKIKKRKEYLKKKASLNSAILNDNLVLL